MKKLSILLALCLLLSACAPAAAPEQSIPETSLSTVTPETSVPTTDGADATTEATPQSADEATRPTEGTKPTDADLATSVTISIGGFQALIAKAAQ